MAMEKNLRISFSEKNNDIYELIKDKKEQAKGFNASDYACNAIRFYEEHKDNVGIDVAYINRLIDERIYSLKKELLGQNFTNVRV